ncbi:MAG: ChaN family lipoprotein [Pelagimonas sp.]|jgi:uncharacterized iron-regulated protein|nr:ChaN family lipoprotein [Pelagimonas sp.]
MRYLILFVIFLSQPLTADTLSEADVIFLGEVHDNPAHHARQAELVARIQPVAVVWEMLTKDLVAKVVETDPEALEAELNWSERGWPDFSMYYPIFQNSFAARHYAGAVPREVAMGMRGKSVAEVFGTQAVLYGLDVALPPAQQEAREDMQFQAHCQAMPREMMGFMVDFQRLRDARLAQAALSALKDTGGPVVVITGNGHARKDWGAPAAILRAAPETTLYALGMGEAGAADPEGGFDKIEIYPPAEREDPCLAFQ